MLGWMKLKPESRFPGESPWENGEGAEIPGFALRTEKHLLSLVMLGAKS